MDVTTQVIADGAYVRLAASGGVPPYRWTAYPGNDPAYAVMGSSTDATGSATSDGAVPLGTPVVYRATDSTGDSADSAPVTVTSPLPVLADYLDPTRHVAVEVRAQLPNAWQGRSVWFDVLDRRDPFVAVAPLRLRSGTLFLTVTGNGQRRAVMAVLASGSPVILRTPDPGAVDDVVALVTDVRESLAVESNPTGPRVVELDYQAVSRELGPYLSDPARTWDTAAAADATWTAASGRFATWQTYAAGIPS